MGARYAEVENVDPRTTVSKLIARWVASEKLDVTPSLVNLRLVKRGPGGVPTAEQESEALQSPARLLVDPSLTLAEAGVVDGSWLLAMVIKPQPMLEGEELAARLEVVERVVPLSAKLFARTVRYSDSKRKSQVSSKLKVELVKLQGGPAPNGLLRCMLLNRLLPYAYVIGAHLLKREWGDMSKELADVDDVEDPRNGLLLYKPLEWAFDTSRLAFTWDEATSRFVAHLLDGHLANVKLVEKAKELLKDRYRRSEDADELGEMCFSDVDGLPLVLPVGFLPFRRCLCLHANLAREEALRNAWLSPGSFEFQDFWSSDGDDKVLAWLHLQQVTLQEVAEEHSNSTSSSGE